MFQKILIANRGEIAARIILTCKAMGIKTVAVYSEADANNPYVRQADEAYCIGTAQAKDSYLKVQNIIKLAKEVGADAVHPGYGFLSENDEFVRGCLAAGIAFIGPNPDVMLAMGKKIQARETMERYGIPVIKGSDGALKDEEEAAENALKIGFPVLLKASGGGGGIGMEVANTVEEAKKAFNKCKARAAASFGDDTVYMEKYLREPRHVEIQIVADKHGNVWHLGERDCSVQRRHQKVIEESASPALTEELRRQMGETAVKAASVIGYDSVGTVEMLLDADKNFYFLEMNTRIQVEHSVTEMRNDVDLVEIMIRAAAGEEVKPLPFNPQGHTMECRIYAEDPYNFYPSCGRITKLNFPLGEDIRIDQSVEEGYNPCRYPYAPSSIRVDHSIEEGSDITLYYDPMIAKVIVWAPNRSACIEKMIKVLNEVVIEGIKTNIPFMLKVLSDEEFRQNGATTKFTDKIIAEMKAERKKESDK